MTDNHMTDDQNNRQDRSRLIDHFKRVYTIVAGLAITEAVRRQFPLSLSTLTNPSFWMFLTFFVTLVPIFHGGDRSLDVKYLGVPRVNICQRFGYLWDVYMLLITAMLFVCIAESIPKPTVSWVAAGEKTFMTDTALFYQLMLITLVFDAAVLLIDYLKSDKQVLPRLESYLVWIPANLVLAGLCYYAGCLAAAAREPTSALVAVDGYSLNLQGVSVFIALIAFVRTFVDYWAGKDFLFP